MKKTWVYKPKKIRATPTSVEKDKVQNSFDDYNTSTLSARIKPFKNREKLMQYTGYYGKWVRSFFYIGLVVEDTRQNALSPAYNEPRIRFEYRAPNLFLCSYLRHTGEWHDLIYGKSISLDKCFAEANSFLLTF